MKVPNWTRETGGYIYNTIIGSVEMITKMKMSKYYLHETSLVFRARVLT